MFHKCQTSVLTSQALVLNPWTRFSLIHTTHIMENDYLFVIGTLCWGTSSFRCTIMSGMFNIMRKCSWIYHITAQCYDHALMVCFIQYVAIFSINITLFVRNRGIPLRVKNELEWELWVFVSDMWLLIRFYTFLYQE